MNNILRHLVPRIVKLRVSSLHFIEMVLALDGIVVVIQIEVLLREPLFDFDGAVVLTRVIGTFIVDLVVVPHPYSLS